MTIAQKLKVTRNKLKLSQGQAAKVWGINLSTLQSWEQSRRTPQGLALTQLESILDKALAKSPAKHE